MQFGLETGCNGEMRAFTKAATWLSSQIPSVLLGYNLRLRMTEPVYCLISKMGNLRINPLYFHQQSANLALTVNNKNASFVIVGALIFGK